MTPPDSRAELAIGGLRFKEFEYYGRCLAFAPTRAQASAVPAAEVGAA
jgi:hypothetical protein